MWQLLHLSQRILFHWWTAIPGRTAPLQTYWNTTTQLKSTFPHQGHRPTIQQLLLQLLQNLCHLWISLNHPTTRNRCQSQIGQAFWGKRTMEYRTIVFERPFITETNNRPAPPEHIHRARWIFETAQQWHDNWWASLLGSVQHLLQPIKNPQFPSNG